MLPKDIGTRYPMLARYQDKMRNRHSGSIQYRARQ